MDGDVDRCFRGINGDWAVSGAILEFRHRDDDLKSCCLIGWHGPLQGFLLPFPRKIPSIQSESYKTGLDSIRILPSLQTWKWNSPPVCSGTWSSKLGAMPVTQTESRVPWMVCLDVQEFMLFSVVLEDKRRPKGSTQKRGGR